MVQEGKDSITIAVRVQPRSSKNEIIGMRSDKLKVKLTSPPVENAANQLCIKLFSKWLGVNKSKIRIISGLKNRNKKIKIDGISKSEFDLFIKSQATKALSHKKREDEIQTTLEERGKHSKKDC